MEADSKGGITERIDRVSGGGGMYGNTIENETMENWTIKHTRTNRKQTIFRGLYRRLIDLISLLTNAHRHTQTHRAWE